MFTREDVADACIAGRSENHDGQSDQRATHLFTEIMSQPDPRGADQIRPRGPDRKSKGREKPLILEAADQVGLRGALGATRDASTTMVESEHPDRPNRDKVSEPT